MKIRWPKASERLFLKAIQKRRRFVEARNGRALAMKLFQEACAMDGA